MIDDKNHLPWLDDRFNDEGHLRVIFDLIRGWAHRNAATNIRFRLHVQHHVRCIETEQILPVAEDSDPYRGGNLGGYDECGFARCRRIIDKETNLHFTSVAVLRNGVQPQS